MWAESVLPFRMLTMEFVVRQRKAVCMRSQNKMLPWLQGGKMRLSVCDISRSGWTADNVWLNSCMEAGRLTGVCLWDPWCALQVLRCLPLSQHSQLLQHVTRSHSQISHPVLIVLGSTQTQLKKSSQVTFIYIALLTIQIVTKHCTISK